MAFSTLQFRSDALNKACSMNVILPERQEKGGPFPVFYLLHGLLQANRDYHDHLNNLDIAHEYEEYPGAHTWEYWDTHVQEAITFHRKTLNI